MGSETESVQTAVAAPPATDRRQQRARVLAVEDDPHGSRAIRRVLERAGYTVELVGDFQGAIDALAGSDFDVVVCDVRLPGGNGLDLPAVARERRPGLPFVFLSGDIDPELQRRVRRMEAAVFLEKPAPRPALLDHVRLALAV